MSIPPTICPGCFTNKGNVAVCGSCGYDESERRSPLVLPHRYVLQGQFLVGRVLGKPGGFGITYLAMDMKLKVKVAIKEYLPRDLAGRDANSATVYPHSKEDADFFAKGLDDFLKEAQNLAQFDHANIVRVRNFFKENDTAYIVMDYYDGITLMEYIQRMGGRIEWQMAIKIMTPIMDALREVHSKGFLHRDIKPQNIYLTRENRIILLDFGSARQAMGERSKSLSMIFTPGFAAFEQYHRRGNQGPWTDVYGVAATIYFMITGEAPPEANGRVERDSIQLPSQMMIGLPQNVEKGLMKGLAVKVGERFESINIFQKSLQPSLVLSPKQQKQVIQPHRLGNHGIIECPECGAKNQLNSGDNPNALRCGKCKRELGSKAVQGKKLAVTLPQKPEELFKFEKIFVQDIKTGLFWARNGNIALKSMNWFDAVKWVNQLTHGGYRDWRLPTKEELEDFAKNGGNRPAEWFNAHGFNGVQASNYWSSTTYINNNNYAGRVYMADGNAGVSIKSYDYFVWPVRGKQPGRVGN